MLLIGFASGIVGGWIGARMAPAPAARLPLAAPAPAAAMAPAAKDPTASAPTLPVVLAPAAKEPDLHDLDLLLRPCGLPDDAGAADLDTCRRERLRKLADAALAAPDRPVVRDQVQLWRAEAASFSSRLDGARQAWLALDQHREAAVAAEAARRVMAGESMHHIGADVQQALEAGRADLRTQEAALAFGRLDRTLLADQVEARLPVGTDNLAAARAVLALSTSGRP